MIPGNTILTLDAFGTTARADKICADLCRVATLLGVVTTCDYGNATLYAWPNDDPARLLDQFVCRSDGASLVGCIYSVTARHATRV